MHGETRVRRWQRIYINTRLVKIFSEPFGALSYAQDQKPHRSLNLPTRARVELFVSCIEILEILRPLVQALRNAAVQVGLRPHRYVKFPLKRCLTTLDLNL
jgi:hypothetical protein